MNENVKKVNDFFESYKKLPVFSNWNLEKISKYVEGLFSYAKFKVGDLVEMADTYPVTQAESWGWMSNRHLLRKGSKAEIVEVDYIGDKTFNYLIKFEEKSWIDDRDNIHSSDRSTSVYIDEKWLTAREPCFCTCKCCKK